MTLGLADWEKIGNTMIKKLIALLILVSSFYFVGATGVLASNNISVSVKTYNGSGTPTVTTPHTGKSRGQEITFTHGDGQAHGFAFYAVNDTIRPELPGSHEFKVMSRMSISVIYDVRESGNVTQHAVVFVDSNRKVLEVKYVAPGALATAPSSLPTPPPNMGWKGVSWLTLDNKSLEDVVTENRVYYAQYQLNSEVSSFQLTVTGGSGSGSYPYNSVVTVTPDTPVEGKVFSHWADAEGNKLSYKASYKVSILAATSLQAVFVDGATSPAEQPVVSMSEDLGIKGSSFVTYKGQMQLPEGYSVVEYGFIFSRSSDVLTLESLGATIVPSNVSYGPTGEFMRSFPDTTFNSLRAYMIVLKGSSVEEVYYSDNIIGGLSSGEQIAYQTGFEASDGFDATTTYNNTSVDYHGKSGKQWGVYYGTPSTNSTINGSQSFQMRWYTSNIANIGYIFTNFQIENPTKIEFNSASSNGLGLKLEYSLDKENWSLIQEISSSNLGQKSILLDLSGQVYFRFKIALPASNPNETSNLRIDDVKIYNNVSTSLHEVIYNNEGAITTSNVSNNGTISYVPSKTGYTFNGWYLESTFDNIFTESVTQSLQLFAKFTINQYDINFDSKGGSAVAKITQNYGTPVTEPVEPIREGYEFNGWYTDNNKFEISYEFKTMGDTNITIYADWIAIDYTITFETNGGTAIAPITQGYQTTVDAPIPPTKGEEIFQGWYTDNVTFSVPYTFSIMPLNGIKLYAKWGNEPVSTVKTGVIAFGNNDTTGSTTNSSVFISIWNAKAPSDLDISSSELISNSKFYTNSTLAASDGYNLKVGSSTAGGANLTVKFDNLTLSKVTINAKSYGSDSGVKMVVNTQESSVIASTAQDYIFNITGDTLTITNIGKRFYIISITLEYTLNP